MRAQNITIDINALHTEQLETLAGLVGDPSIVKQIHERIAFIDFEEFC